MLIKPIYQLKLESISGVARSCGIWADFGLGTPTCRVGVVFWGRPSRGFGGDGIPPWQTGGSDAPPQKIFKIKASVKDNLCIFRLLQINSSLHICIL